MSKLLKLVFTGAVALSLASTTASADVKKGQKLYAKKLKRACGMTGADMAKKHTQGEWESIGVSGLKAEIKKICPDVTDRKAKDRYMEHFYDFFYEYASDSGNVPSC